MSYFLLSTSMNLNLVSDSKIQTSNLIFSTDKDVEIPQCPWILKKHRVTQDTEQRVIFC